MLLLNTCEKPERVLKINALQSQLADITYSTAILKGEIIDIGSQPVTDHGIIVSENQLPTEENGQIGSLGAASKKGSYQVTITGLTKNTKYYFRAFAATAGEITYSDNTENFTTKDSELSTVTVGSVSDLTMTSASLSGEVISDGGETVTIRGFCWGTSENPTIVSSIDTTVNGSGIGTFSGNLKGLSPGTSYYARAYAVNAKGISYSGSDIALTTHNIPAVTTDPLSDITNNSAKSGGNVTDEGGVPVTSRGVCWSTSHNPTADLVTKTTDGSGEGIFISDITGLNPGTTYYVRAYATNQYGTGYGNEVSNSTTQPPTVSTNDATQPGSTTFTLNGLVNANGLSTSVSFEYGETVLYGNIVSATPENVTGNTDTQVSADLTGLNQGTTYHFRVTASNQGGTSNGNDKTFTTYQEPSATTLDASAVTNTTATLNGSVNANNYSTVVTFEYGLTTSYGSTADAIQSPVTGNLSIPVSSGITGLSPGTTYYFRIKAVNVGGTVYSTGLSFKTNEAPEANTGSASSVTQNSAILNASVNAHDLSTIVTFEYGSTTGYGLSVTASQSPVAGSSDTPVSAAISGLNASSTYHFRVKAESAGGTVYGNDAMFITTAAPMTINDYDGNIYNIVTIGSQQWIQSNLKNTHYNNGDVIPNVTGNSSWNVLSTGALSWYNNDATTYKNTYGGLYNGYAAADIRNICPVGWHVPDDTEWGALTTYIGGEASAGGKLKETGTSHWASPNTGATNETGFSALPAGSRETGGSFAAIGYSAFFWSTTEFLTGSDYARAIFYNQEYTTRSYYDNRYGYSVRCIKGSIPLVESVTASAVSSTSATSNGNANPNGLSTAVSFEYGVSTSYGSEITAVQSPLTGSAPVAVYANLTGLDPGTVYHYRIKAVNADGISYGKDIAFTTTYPPQAVTEAATSVGQNSATLNGTVNANGLSTTVTFEYGLTTGYGSTATAAESPVTGSTSTPVSAPITGLSPSTTYHFRVKAASAGGTVYGNDATFDTPASSVTVSDFEGNIYNTVIIGTQEWMSENLKATKFNNGTPIPLVANDVSWQNLTTAGYCWLNNDEASFKNIYGALYNWYSINTGMLCPTGWHAPADDEWVTLTTYLGGEGVAGGKLKEAGTTHWQTPNTGATNESGFTALPGGYRFDYGAFDNSGDNGHFWSSTEYSSDYVWYQYILYNEANSHRTYNHKRSGFAIRCIKGEQPFARTDSASVVTSISVTLNGNVYANGTATTVSFEYGTTTGYGMTATAIQSPINGTTPLNVNTNITGLTPNTTYHFRVKATNSGGTNYGSDLTFTTPETVTDVDFNTYNTVIIGSQTWMMENLKTTKYNDGSNIPLVTDQAAWSTSGAAYCWPFNDQATYGYPYGALYKWYCVSTDKLCPTGWHAPSDTEWATLRTFLGGETIAGGKLKETGTSHWQSPNTGATNETGFTALGGGERDLGAFDQFGLQGTYWSATSSGGGNAIYYEMANSNTNLFRITVITAHCGRSVRCIKD